MADTTTRYRPRAYRRVCDVCGMLRNIDDMHKQEDLWVCTYDSGERVRVRLDRLNAQERPFAIKPVPYPKPQDPWYPNTLETDDAAVFNFLSQQVEARCRYEQVVSGSAPLTSLGGAVSGMAWAAKYFYDLIQSNDRPRLTEQAKDILAEIADYLLTRQYGSRTGPSPSSTRANDAYFGAIIDTGQTVIVTEDVAMAGLALLNAYLVHGDAVYIVGARSAASYLRNVQSIGAKAEQFTASNAAGTSRLYTGALASQVSTYAGVDPGETFYSNHCFYPSGLLALDFWNQLKTADGDQSVGTTGTPNGFAFAADQTLSQSITDLRTCWETGITDATATLVNGLSSTTPREFFNAFPQAKPRFNFLIGSGMWEFADGTADDGTQITSQNFARALGSLYSYESASSQVTGISDWLRAFTSNPDFETPDNTSTSELYHGTTGTYDPTLTIATLLTVRDADNNYVAVKTNGSSIYDWGAFGLLSRLWASRYAASFRVSRLVPLGTFQRYYDGNNTDTATDRIILRGISGLTMQSGAESTIPVVVNAATWLSSGGTLPGLEGIAAQKLWLEADYGTTLNGGGQPIAWEDRSPAGNDVTSSGGVTVVPNGIGTQTAFFSDGQRFESTGPNIFEDGDPRTVIVICKPTLISDIGGYLVVFRRGGGAGRVFAVGLWTPFGGGNQYLYTNCVDAADNIERTPVVNYANQSLIIVYQFDGDTMNVTVNGQVLPVTQNQPGTEDGTDSGFYLLNIPCGGSPHWRGYTSLFLVYGLPRAPQDAIAYSAIKYGINTDVTTSYQLMANDAVAAAQFGRTFREAR